MGKRIFLIVLDSLGIGAAPDAKNFGDEFADTMRTISKSNKFHIPNLLSLGLAEIDGLDYLNDGSKPTAAVARMRERSAGKDTTVGHWEIAGIVSDKPLPTYPNGFPREIIEKFEIQTGRKVLCNKPYSGTDVIRDYGEEQVKTGALIVYTSADSVFQIAAHEDIVPPEKLYEYCRIARDILTGEHSVGRVIARPFVGSAPDFKRTPNRHDFSLKPFAPTMLDEIKESGKDVISVGKINDIFAGCGITRSFPSMSNVHGMELTSEIAETDFDGICFTNLVDFDSAYGHRNDIDGYAAALSEFDTWLGGFIKNLRDGDVLMITADHGCDPGDNSTDHTREYTPLIIYGNGIKPINLGTRDTFADISATICTLLGVEYKTVGQNLTKLLF